MELEVRMSRNIGQEPLRSLLYIPYIIPFIPVHQQYTMRCDMLITVGLFSILKSRGTVGYAGPAPKSVHALFKEYMTHIKLVLDTQSVVHE